MSHTVYASRVESFSDIEDIWQIGQTLEDKDGNYWMISKMGIDRRGYNEASGGIRRTDEVDAFVNYMTQRYGEDRIYATEGHAKLSGDKAFTVVNSRDMSNNRNKVDIKIIKLSDLYLKNTMRRAIDRTIAKVKGDEEAEAWESDLFYINEDIILVDSESVTRKSYTRQYTCEVYDFKMGDNGKLDKEKSWFIPTKGGKEGKGDNHYFDTGVICYALAELDKVSLIRKPEEFDDISGFMNKLKF